jgi:hypothetical protein
MNSRTNNEVQGASLLVPLVDFQAPASCRKFKSCNAPQCPLDQGSLTSTYIHGEPVCFWLTEYSKGNHHELEAAMGGIPLEVISGAYEGVYDTYGSIRNRLERASRTPSRLKGAS